MSNEQLLVTLKQEYRKLRLYVLLMLLLLVAALVFVFVNRIVSLVLIGACAVFYIFVFRREQQRYADSITEANLSCTVAKTLGTEQILPKSGGTITKETIEHAAMMPVKEIDGSPLLCWGMNGSLNNLPVSVCDATIAQDFSLQEKGKKRVHFNAGAWVHVELPEDTNQRWCLLDETSVPTPIRMDYFSHKMNMQTASVGNDIIGKKCVLYQPAEKERQLSSQLLHEIQKLIEYTPGYVAISVKGNCVDFFLRGRFLSRAVSISQAPTKELIEFDPFPELKYLLKIAKAI